VAAKKDTGAWTRAQIQKERARIDAPREFWVVTTACEARSFDNVRDAVDFQYFVGQSTTAVLPTITKTTVSTARKGA
jgi:hypothetical protein